MAKRFVFNPQRCVGCQACVLACMIENNSLPNDNWRRIYKYNELHHPALPAFYLSLACHHCYDAPCMNNCPAKAYTKDPLSGIVLHHADKCIGCKYCSWSCPYDVPVFAAEAGVMQKCDMCLSRISQGQNPACVDSCPVNALSLEDSDENNQWLPGFDIKNTMPSLHLKKPGPSAPRISPAPENIEGLSNILEKRYHRHAKLNPLKEWSLLLFSIIAALTTAAYWADIAGKIPIPNSAILLPGMAAMMLSTAHLGKPLRAPRALLNIRHSWLSREITLYALFIILAAAHYLLNIKIFGVMALISGLAACLAFDKVYAVLKKVPPENIHSASVTLSCLLMVSLLFQSTFFSLLLIALKISIYFYRKISLAGNTLKKISILSIIRLVLPLILCLLFIFSNPGIILSICLALPAEIIDRIEFYAEAEKYSTADYLRQISSKI